MNSSALKLLIGLGNPEKNYLNTYHNAGYLFIDYLKGDPKLQMHPNLQIFKSKVYMNESGRFVSEILKKTGTKPEELLIIQDDSDLYLGDYKFSFDQSSAGHKGIENIIKSLKTKKINRLRIGIRPKISVKRKRLKAEKFVLKKINDNNKKNLKEVFKSALNDLNKKIAIT